MSNEAYKVEGRKRLLHWREMYDSVCLHCSGVLVVVVGEVVVSWES